MSNDEGLREFLKPFQQRFETQNLTIKVVFAVAYSIITCFAVLSNVLVCQTVLKNWRSMGTTHLFILNLCVGNLLVTFFNTPFALVRFVSSDWVFGSTMCHVSWFSQYCSLYVLTLTLMAITLDQYQVILNPLKPRMSLSKGILSIVIIWTLASCFSLPHAIYQTLFHYVYRKKIIRSLCLPTFPKPSEVFRRYYVLPLVVITVASVTVSKNLLMRETNGAVTEAEATAQRRRKKRTIKMIVLLVVAFALCWFPLNVYTFLLTDQFVQFNNTLYFAFHWVAVSSTCWNPFIYCWMDNRFRSDLMTLLAKCGGRRRRGGKILPLTAVSGDGRQSGVRWEDKPGPSTEKRRFYLGGRRGNNGEPINLQTCTSLECGKKLEHPEETHTVTGRTCKQQQNIEQVLDDPLEGTSAPRPSISQEHSGRQMSQYINIGGTTPGGVEESTATENVSVIRDLVRDGVELLRDGHKEIAANDYMSKVWQFCQLVANENITDEQWRLTSTSFNVAMEFRENRRRAAARGPIAPRYMYVQPRPSHFFDQHSTRQQGGQFPMEALPQYQAAQRHTPSPLSYIELQPASRAAFQSVDGEGCLSGAESPFDEGTEGSFELGD